MLFTDAPMESDCSCLNRGFITSKIVPATGWTPVAPLDPEQKVGIHADPGYRFITS